jgi:hypothetical protein
VTACMHAVQPCAHMAYTCRRSSWACIITVWWLYALLHVRAIWLTPCMVCAGRIRRGHAVNVMGCCMWVNCMPVHMQQCDAVQWRRAGALLHPRPIVEEPRGEELSAGLCQVAALLAAAAPLLQLEGLSTLSLVVP